MLSDKKSINPRGSNHSKEKIRLMGNNNENIQLVNIDQQTPTAPNWTTENGLLTEFPQNSGEIMFSQSGFLVGTQVLDTRYEHLQSQ